MDLRRPPAAALAAAGGGRAAAGGTRGEAGVEGLAAPDLVKLLGRGGGEGVNWSTLKGKVVKLMGQSSQTHGAK